MIETFFSLLEIAALNVAILIIANKWDIVEVYQLNRKRWMPDSCNFCFFFWASLAQLAFIHIMSVINSPTGLLSFYEAVRIVFSCFSKSLICAVLSLQFYKSR